MHRQSFLNACEVSCRVRAWKGKCPAAKCGFTPRRSTACVQPILRKWVPRFCPLSESRRVTTGARAELGVCPRWRARPMRACGVCVDTWCCYEIEIRGGLLCAALHQYGPKFAHCTYDTLKCTVVSASSRLLTLAERHQAAAAQTGRRQE
jgi:hypothetical protein